MVRRVLLSVAVGMLLIPPARGQTGSARCGAGRDLIVQALETVTAGSPDAEVVRANALLKRAANMCSGLGDAWYYRSLMERRLKHADMEAFALGRARVIGSEAMTEGTDPFTLATAPGAQKFAPEQGARWALVIGINRFKDDDLNTLKYTASDAEMFASVLENPRIGAFPADHVHVLLNGEATTKGIKESLNWIARQAQPEDLVVVYMATHGSPRDFDSVGGINYLITSDTEGGSTDDQDALYATALPVIDLVNTVATRIRALRTAIFLDACYSGSAHASTGQKGTRASSLDDRTLQQFRQGSGRIIMSAAREDQESNESDKLAHGFFTYYLAQSLQAGGGQAPLSMVFANVHRQVMAEVATELKNFHVRQEPVMSRSSEATDFGLGRSVAETPSGSAAVAPQ